MSALNRMRYSQITPYIDIQYSLVGTPTNLRVLGLASCLSGLIARRRAAWSFLEQGPSAGRRRSRKKWRRADERTSVHNGAQSSRPRPITPQLSTARVSNRTLTQHGRTWFSCAARAASERRVVSLGTTLTDSTRRVGDPVSGSKHLPTAKGRLSAECEMGREEVDEVGDGVGDEDEGGDVCARQHACGAEGSRAAALPAARGSTAGSPARGGGGFGSKRVTAEELRIHR